jgi:transposase
VRQARARALLESMRQWFESRLPELSRKSDTTGAIRHTLGLWDALLRYCNNGHLEIDNNAGERALRAVALGRKNAGIIFSPAPIWVVSGPLRSTGLYV